MLMVQLKYQDGTTDITRTFHFGKPSAHEKACYTAVSAFLSYILLDHGVHPVLEFSLTSRPVRCLIVLCISKHRHYVLFLLSRSGLYYASFCLFEILALQLHIWGSDSSEGPYANVQSEHGLSWPDTRGSSKLVYIARHNTLDGARFFLMKKEGWGGRRDNVEINIIVVDIVTLISSKLLLTCLYWACKFYNCSYFLQPLLS